MKNNSTIITEDTFPETKKGFQLVYDYKMREIHIASPEGLHVCHGYTEPDKLGKCVGFPFPRKK